MLGAALFLSGALALLVWRGTCREPVLFWFGITALGASTSAFLLLWPPQVAHGGINCCSSPCSTSISRHCSCFA